MGVLHFIYRWILPLGGLLTWLALGVGFFASYSRRNHDRYGGPWEFTITWDEKWARTNLVKNQALHGLVSKGRVTLVVGAGPKHDQYWGYGEFLLSNGVTKLAHVYANLANWRFDVNRAWWPTRADARGSRWPLKRFTLKGFDLQSMCREQLQPFDYGQRACYYVDFVGMETNVLTGKIKSDPNGAAVGEINGNRGGA